MNQEYRKSSVPKMRIAHHFKGEEVVTIDGARLIIGDDYRFKSNKVAKHVIATDAETGQGGIIIAKCTELRNGKRWFISHEE